MISICLGVKDRVDQVLNHLIKSMNACIHKNQLVLVVFDCGTLGLHDKIKKVWIGELVYRTYICTFSRTYSLNQAAEVAPSQYLFFCDADMSLPVDFVEQFLQNVSPKKVWFPVCFSLYENRPAEMKTDYGYWRYTGYGMSGFFRQDFIDVGRFNERFVHWGAEDNDIFERCKAANFKIVRGKCRGLYHNWHPIKKFGLDD